MKDMEVVVDASVVVKWFVEEDGYEGALELRDRYVAGELSIIAPELIIYEVLNALYHKGLHSPDEMEAVAEALEAYSLALYPLRGEYSKKTVATAFRNNITIYDASYIALAMFKNTQVYTADEKLLGRLKEEYLKHVKSIKQP